MSDTRTDDEIAELFAAANPLRRPGAPASEAIELVPTSEPRSDRDSVGGDPVLVPADNGSRERWPLVGLVAAAVALVVSLLVTSIRDDRESVPADQPVQSTLTEPEGTEPAESTTTTDPASEQVDAATAFWQAMADRDREAALSLVEPWRAEGDFLPFGWGDTLEESFAWQEVVGWQTTLEECGIGEGTYPVQCTATVSNAWFDALGVEPITAKFAVEFGDSGITLVADAYGSFRSEYLPKVFEVFDDWVRTNHPEDARLMWESEDHENSSEVLRLFRINTERFVESQEDASTGPADDAADLVEEPAKQQPPGTSGGG